MADRKINPMTIKNNLDVNPYIWKEKEKARLKNIEDYNFNDLQIDDEGLVCIARLAANICKTPCAAVDIIKSEIIEIHTKIGFDDNYVERKNSFFSETIEQDDVFIVEDTMKDHRFDNNKYVKVKENKLRFYAGHPLRTKEGYNIGAICVFDTQPKTLDEQQKYALKTLSKQVVNFFELERQNKRLIEANILSEKLAKSKEDFFSNISHELRTPLNAINGYAEILSKCQLTENQMEAVETIKNSSEILICLINDILDFSKLNSGKLIIEHLPFNLHKTVKLVYDLLNIKANEKKLQFKLNYDERIPDLIIGDKVRINQIIMNLVGNAIKFTEKGLVVINVNLIEEKNYKKNEKSENSINIKFSIKDTGIGIKEKCLDTIFNRFEQADGGMTYRKYGGSGLGLNISKNLVELQGGKLNVISKFGKGTEFFFELKFDLPRKSDNIRDRNISEFPSQEQSNTQNIFSDSNLLQNLKILVCEDNNINIKLIELILKNKVSKLVFAENGKIAIEMLKNINNKSISSSSKNNFDLILMDIHMPILDGLKTTEYIRQNLKLDIPILGHTANFTESERELAYKSGMNDYFLKTFSKEDLCEKISKNILELSKRKDMKNNFKFHTCENDERFNKRRSKSNICLSFNNKTEVQKKSKSSLHFDYEKNTTKFNKENLKKSSFFPKKTSISSNSTSNSERLESPSPEKNINFASPRLYHVNLDTLKDYSEGDKEFEKKFIEVFIENFDHDIKSLEEDINVGNFSQVKFWTHKMKGPLMMLGLFSILKQLEELNTLSLNPDSKNKLILESKNFYKNINYILTELNEILIRIKNPEISTNQ